MSTSQISKLLGCSNRTVREFLARGVLHGERQPNSQWRVSRVAHLLERQPRTIRMKADHRTLPAFKIGRAWFFWRADVENHITFTQQAGYDTYDS